MNRTIFGYVFFIPNWRNLLGICSGLGLILFFIIAMISFLRKTPLILFFYSFSTLSLIVFNYYIHLSAFPRHSGHHFIILITAIWLCIAGYLNRTIYYPERKEEGSFAPWLDRNNVDILEVLKQIDKLLTPTPNLVNPDSILLILNYPLEISNETSQVIPSTLIIQPIKEFEDSILPEERYYLYWVKRL